MRPSPNTERALALARPRMRGVLHRVAAVLWPAVAVGLVVAAPAGRARAAVAVFGVSMWLMLATSAVVHLRRWGLWATELLFRADHTAIFVAVAGTATPIAVIALPPSAGTRLLLLAWGLAALGTVVVWHPAATPFGFANTAFIGLGGVVAAFAPGAAATAGPGFLVLLGLGGAVYVLGALMVAARWPEPLPGVVGYHEVWHLLVLVGLGFHTTMVATTLLPAAG